MTLTEIRPLAVTLTLEEKRQLADELHEEVYQAGIEHWMQTEARATCERLAAGTEPTYTPDEIRSHLRNRRTERRSATA